MMNDTGSASRGGGLGKGVGDPYRFLCVGQARRAKATNLRGVGRSRCLDRVPTERRKPTWP